MLPDLRVFSSVISLVIWYSSAFNSLQSTTLWFSTCAPHNKALLCVTSLARILSVVNHFSSISVTQSKTRKTAKVLGLHALCIYLFLQVTCLPNCPGYNYICKTLCIKIMLAITKCMSSKINPYMYWITVIGIAEKSHETRRDRWGGNVNDKSLFWLSALPWHHNSYIKTHSSVSCGPRSQHAPHR